MMTKHTYSILHGVTRLHSGIRCLSLYDNGLGDDESVFRVDRDYIEKYQKKTKLRGKRLQTSKIIKGKK